MAVHFYTRAAVFLLGLSVGGTENALFVRREKNGFSLTCLGGGNSSLTWIGADFIDSPRENDVLERGKKVRSSYNFNLPPALDWRWRDFRRETCKCGSKTELTSNLNDVKVLTISLRFREFVTLRFNDLADVVLYENTTTATFGLIPHDGGDSCRILDDGTPWRHYNLYFHGRQFFLSKTVERDVAKFKLKSLQLTATRSDVEFKVHNYKVVSSDEFQITSEDPICWSVFYFTQRRSTMYINKEEIKTDSFNSWKELRFIGHSLEFSSQYQIITDVRKCAISEIGRIETSSKSPLACQDIANEMNIPVRKPVANVQSDICDKHEELCKKSLICEESQCFCLDGYNGEFCEKDKSMERLTVLCDGTWGTYCENPCGKNCKNGHCHQTNGICLEGCEPTFFGTHCNQKCPRNCKAGICDSNGFCSNGCSKNFAGSSCDTCIADFWGPDCDRECSIGCKLCLRDGSCAHGCLEGYYGMNCARKCARGCLDACDFVKGACVCRKGYDIESKCEIYRYLHERPEILKTGPDYARLAINTTELDENANVKIFNEENECTATPDFYITCDFKQGQTYELEVVVCVRNSCERGNPLNARVNFTTCLVPDASMLQLESFSKSVLINLRKQGTLCEKYVLSYAEQDGEQKTIDFNASTEIKDLRPFTDYEIAIFGYDGQRIYSTEIKTGEMPPSQPLELNFDEENSLIRWHKPNQPNGVIRKFQVFVNDTQVGEVEFAHNQNVFEYKLDLSNAEIYKVTVNAVNSLEGENGHIKIITKPTKPKITVKPTGDCEQVCNVDVIIEGKLNSAIYELASTSEVGENCEGEVLQQGEFHGGNIITLIGVRVDSVICVENSFHGRKSALKVAVISPQNMDMKQAHSSYLYLLLSIPVIIFIAFITLRHFRIKSNAKAVLKSLSDEDVEIAEKLIEKNDVLDAVAIPRGQFQEYLKNLICEEIGVVQLDSEFSNIPVNQGEAKLIGKMEGNAYKNRYKEVLPYDHTRVVLHDVPEDYINASYIEGYNGARTYIATQCPKSITINDFWRMICQERVEIIVMLSTLSEGLHRMTCYWPPDNSSWDYKDIKVTHVESLTRTGFIAKTFAVKFQEIERKVVQISCTTWPDCKNPLFPLSLIDLLKYVRIIRGINTAPIVVHCSAGLGRTGSFIICDHYFNTHVEIINVPMKLKGLRKCRSSLVQTQIQYRLIYFILNEIITMDAAKDVSLDVVKTLDKAAVQELVDNDLRYIHERSYLDKLLYKNRKLLEENRRANQNPRIGAVSESAIILPELNNEKNSSYINAVHAHGYEHEYKFVSTQIPLKSTVREFWRMAYDTSNEIIVVLQDTNDCQFWPSSCDYPLKPEQSLRVFCTNESDKEFYKVYDLELTHTSREDKQKITLFSFRAWNAENTVPNSVESFFTLYNDVCAFNAANKKITLCCSDGAIGCGLFIAFDLLINKIVNDNVFNVCWAVRSIKGFRNEFIDTSEQLFYLYELAKYYMNKWTNSTIEEPDYENLMIIIEQMRNM